MCGILGIWHRDGRPVDRETITVMRDRMACRGPDDAGVWIDGCVGLGHRRLSVLDLSHAGRQPMIDEDAGSVIVYNGEIYNYREIGRELASRGVSLHSRTDTEVALKAYRIWGRECLERFNGMFAFGLWDPKKKGLFLARDRIGIKPLYYSIDDETVLFASRLGALAAHPCCPRRIDPEALGLFLELGYVPAPWSIFQGVRKLLPGHCLWIDQTGVSEICYWNPDEIQINPSLAQTPVSALTERLNSLIRDSVKQRMISDVPLGAFLSGGIDSFLIVSSMRDVAAETPRTFTIGFQDPVYNEADQARRIAGCLDTRHSEKRMNSSDLIELLSAYGKHYDEPFADASALPTMILSRFAREQVTVCLSGDGGDELFAGYTQYRRMNQLQLFYRLPLAFRNAFGQLLQAAPRHHWSMLGRCVRKPDVIDGFAYARSIMKHSEPDWLYPDHGITAGQLFHERAQSFPQVEPINQWSRLDFAYYLPDDILQKVDVASMAIGLEVRVPLLDRRIVEFALSLPAKWKIKGRWNKWLLRKVLAERMPRHQIDSTKRGFNIPIASWFRQGCRDLIRDELNPDRMEERMGINPSEVRRMIDLHMSGAADTSPLLFALMTLMLWNKNLSSSSLSVDHPVLL
ncbi:MAG: asparagine synthase (glutamine-hydrolyzing) [Sedimentisphaerales bacterium]|nr:asparagine synthase (glutamine-hydrolyzing) [Sedimentisphaerales bacterium]